LAQGLSHLGMLPSAPRNPVDSSESAGLEEWFL